VRYSRPLSFAIFATCAGTPAQTWSGQQPPTPATPVVPHSGAALQAQQSGNQRSLLSLQGGPADAFNKATHAHHSTKEAHTPSKTNPTQPLNNSKALEAGAAHRPAQPVDSSITSTPRLQESAAKETLIKLPKATHQPNPAASRPTQTNSQRNLLSTQNGPADAFNKATKKYKSHSAATLKPQHTNATKQHAVRRVHPPKLLATHTPKLSESSAPQVAPTGQKIVTTIPITTMSSTAGSQRSLLAGPADAFNKATHAHHATKEATIPSKTSPLTKPQEVPSGAQRSLLSLQGGPADAFNKATHAHKQTKEAARPSKTNPTQPLANTKGLEAGAAHRPARPVDRSSNTNQLKVPHNPAAPNKPLIKPQEAAKVVNKKQPAATNTPKATSTVAPGAPKDAARNLLQWGGWNGGGWSGSQSQAQAQAQSQGWGGGGFGGWGGSGSQGECRAGCAGLLQLTDVCIVLNSALHA